MNAPKLKTIVASSDAADAAGAADAATVAAPKVAPKKPPEHGGPEGPEPTRYGDWERKGRCIDF